MRVCNASSISRAAPRPPLPYLAGVWTFRVAVLRKVARALHQSWAVVAHALACRAALQCGMCRAHFSSAFPEFGHFLFAVLSGAAPRAAPGALARLFENSTIYADEASRILLHQN